MSIKLEITLKIMAHHCSTLTQLITSSSYDQNGHFEHHAKQGEINLYVAICILKSLQKIDIT